MASCSCRAAAQPPFQPAAGRPRKLRDAAAGPQQRRPRSAVAQAWWFDGATDGQALRPAGPFSPWPRQPAPPQAEQPQLQPLAPSPPAAAAGYTPPRVQQYVGLRAEDFAHPLDAQNTALLRALPGLGLLARSMLSPVQEQVLLLENVATSVRVGPDQLPSLHGLLATAARLLSVQEPPELYVRQSPVPNAYTLAIPSRRPFIVLHTALVELLTPAELQVVLAHELGHLKCDHGVWLTAANVLALGTVQLLPLVSGAVEDGLLRWLRAAELTCDRAALLVAQDSRLVVSVLMKMAGGTPSLASELSPDAFLRQARSYDEAASSPLGWYLRNAQVRALSHPLPVLRAREIDRWAAGPQYAALLARNRPAEAGHVSA